MIRPGRRGELRPVLACLRVSKSIEAKRLQRHLIIAGRIMPPIIVPGTSAGTIRPGEIDMTFDPARNRMPDTLLPNQVWYRMFTNLVFDGFVKVIIRDRFHINPVHVSLHVTRHSTML